MGERAAGLPKEASVRRAAEAEHIPFGPTDVLRFVSDGGEGLPDFYEERAARGDGPPLHAHTWPSWELVISGRIRFVVGDDEHLLGASDAIYIPAGTPHTYIVESDAAHAVGINLSEGRFPSLQRRAAPLMAMEGPPPMDEIAALAADHGLTVLGPPLALGDAPSGRS